MKIHNLYYWADAFRAPDVEKLQVPVRYDPFDAGTAYAFVNKQWTECHSEYFTVFHGRSEKEMMLATEEMRKSMQHHQASSLSHLGNWRSFWILSKRRKSCWSSASATWNRRRARRPLRWCREQPSLPNTVRLL